MKRTYPIIQIFYFCCCSAISMSEVGAQHISKANEILIDSIMNANYKSTDPGAVLLIAKNGEPIYRKAFGMANIESKIPNSPEKVFRIGSMSKQFTAVCILKLAQEGKLHLEDDIKKYLPEYNTHGKHISIENLLNHTSGIPGYTEKSDFFKKSVTDYSKTEIMNYFMQDSLLFEPGSDWSYSNSAYFLAGIIIEKVSGKSYGDYLMENIFTPLGMANSSVGNNENNISNAAVGYESAGNNKYKTAANLSWTWPFGAGSVLSTADDLLKWDNALYTDKIILQKWLAKAWKQSQLANGQESNYGMGWTVGQYKGLEIISHGGAINGFLSDGIRIPSQQLYLVVLSNSTAFSPSELAVNIAMQLAGKPIAKPAFKKMDNKLLGDYTGVYDIHRAGARLLRNSGDEKQYRYLTVKGDTLFSMAAGSTNKMLIYKSTDLFTSTDGHTIYRFHRDGKRKVLAVEIYSEPIQYGPTEMEFKSKLPLPNEKQAVTVDVKKLQPLVGKYDFGGGFFIEVLLSGSTVFIKATDQDKEELFAESEDHFFLKTVDATIEFKKESGKIIGMVLRQGGKYEGKKVE